MSTAAFWDKIAPKYAARPIDDMEAYEQTLTRTRSFLHHDDHLLELGCGTGGTAIKLAPSVAKITATDISGGMIEIAESKLTDAAPQNIRFLQAPATQPLADAPFDAIVAFNLLHLLEDLPAAVAHLHAQVKTGGYVITKSGCLAEMNFLLPYVIKVMQWLGKAPSVNSFTAATLDETFRQAGFDLIETGYFGKSETNRFIVARKR